MKLKKKKYLPMLSNKSIIKLINNYFQKTKFMAIKAEEHIKNSWLN